MQLKGIRQGDLVSLNGVVWIAKKDVEEGVVPGPDTGDFWSELVPFVSTVQYEVDSYVIEGDKVYVAVRTSEGSLPSLQEKLWIKIDDYLVPEIPGVIYEKGSFVGFDSNFSDPLSPDRNVYRLNAEEVANTGTNPDDPRDLPDSGRRLWRNMDFRSQDDAIFNDGKTSRLGVIVFLDSGDDRVFYQLKANRTSIGPDKKSLVSPSDAVPLWEVLPTFEEAGGDGGVVSRRRASYSDELVEKLLVEFDTRVFELNADNTAEQPLPGRLLWRDLLASGPYTNRDTRFAYAASDLSSEVFYTLNAESTQVMPPFDPASGNNLLLKLVDVYPTDSSIRASNSRVYSFGGMYYSLNGLTSNYPPNTLDPPATGPPIKLVRFISGTVNSDGEFVQEDGMTPVDLGGISRDSIDRITESIVEGDPISIVGSDVNYTIPEDNFFIYRNTLYRASAEINIWPNLSTDLWSSESIVPEVGDIEISGEGVIRNLGLINENAYYRITVPVATPFDIEVKAFASVSPNSRIGTIAGATITFDPIWQEDSSVIRQDTAQYPKDSVAKTDSYYEAQATNSIDPVGSGLSINIWSEITSIPEVTLVEETYNVSPGDTGEFIIKQGEDDVYQFVYKFETKYYVLHADIAANTTTSDIPAPTGLDSGPVWEVVSPPTTAYQPSVGYSFGNYVRSGSSVWEPNVDVRGNAPDSVTPVWEIELNFCEYPGECFIQHPDGIPQGTLVYYEEGSVRGYFLANAVPDDVLPGTDVTIWKFDRLISRYDPITEFRPRDLVQFEGNLFQALAEFRDVVPTSTMLIWEPFDPDAIPAYSSSAAYRKGDFVQLGTQVFQANAATFGISPDEAADLWTKEVTLLEYNPLVTYDPASPGFPGDPRERTGLVYVKFENSIFRPLTRVVGEDPESDPTKWNPVGFIKEYTSDQIFYTNCHIRFESKVYKAKQIVPANIPPDLEAPDEDVYWEFVPASYSYKYFRRLLFERLEITTDVQDVRSLVLENDQGVIDATKPFNPFGTVPTKGANFYIGSSEIFFKRLLDAEDSDALLLKMNWGNLPALNFGDYYQNYILKNGDPVNIENNQHFKMTLSTFKDGTWVPFMNEANDAPEPFDMFLNVDCNTGEVSENGQCPGPEKYISIKEDILPERIVGQEEITEFDLGLQGGFIRLQLAESFYHDEFPRSLTKSTIKRAAEENDPPVDGTGSPLPLTEIPNEPYTPLINSFSVNYHSREIINLKGRTKSDFANRVEQFFHIYPFGQAEFYPIPESPSDEVFTSPHLVPLFQATQFDEEGIPKFFDANGSLYIGLQEVKPLQSVHILFQLAEGSEEPDREKQAIAWSYLSNNLWKDFILSEEDDDTNGLLRPGIVKLSLPRDITSDNTVLPGDTFWIKASVIEFADGVARSIAVLPQAVKATFDINEENADRVAVPIGPGTIGSLLVREAAIGGVTQSFASFNGREKETDEQFYRRISERLRHKARGVTVVDYELLVLEAFPEVQQAKCLNHTSRDSELTPGQVTLIVAPSLQNKNAPDLLRPELSKNKRDEIRQFLARHVSSFTELAVDSPEFEQIQVEVTVKFRDGKDLGFYTRQLRDDLVLFISPWVEDKNQDLSFGKQLNRADLLSFIDARSYVDFVNGLTLYHEVKPLDLQETKEAIPTSSRSVLTSVPAAFHKVIAFTDKK